MSLGERGSRPAAFLDRDGVLNVDTGYPHRTEELILTPGAAEAVRLLNDAGCWVVVVTNQSGVALGRYAEAQVRAFNAALAARLAAEAGARIDAFYYCPYHPEAVAERYRAADHPDRKPNPGMILRAMRDLPIRRRGSFLVGDRESDLAAAAAAGLPGYLYEGRSLRELVRAALAAESAGL